MANQQKFEFEARVEDGVIVPLHKVLMRRLLRRYEASEEKEAVLLQVTVGKLVRSRSAKQNRYYWGVAIPTIRAHHKRETGENISQDELHTYHLNVVMGLKPEVKTILGEEVVSFNIKRTSDMTTVEFTDFIDNLIKFWAERGCEIPVPKGESMITDYLTDN